MSIPQRKLGQKGPWVSAIGMGCWAIGGTAERNGKLHGWVDTSDQESVRAVHAGIDLGITFLDTADVYGAGHSENLLGPALQGGLRQKIVLATKFSKLFDETKNLRLDDSQTDVSPAFVRKAVEGSLRRLKTDYIDLYQLHDGQLPLDQVPQLLDTLDSLVTEGKIRGYGWSTDDANRASAFAEGKHCWAIQQKLNIFEGKANTLAVCESAGLASICRSPMAQGLLTGKFNANTTFQSADLRAGWNFREGARAQQLDGLAQIREILTQQGRSLAQGALGWLLSRSSITIPIPGFKNVKQITDNVGTLNKDPLPAASMAEIEHIVAGLR
jgi:aryl-alcohol dehydrogenase-like predicted oxidoreductase